MAELNRYKCKHCNWEIIAPEDGFDFLMEGAYYLIMCPACKSIQEIYLGEDETTVKRPAPCPKCGNSHTFYFSPKDNCCPECGGELEDCGFAGIVD